MEITDVLNEFGIYSSCEKCAAFGNGNINKTFLVSAGGEDFVLQYVNNDVFRDIDGLMNNLSLVTGHIESKYPGQNRTLCFLRTKNGKLYSETDGHEFIRISRFIKGTHSVDYADSPAMLEKLGSALGDFQRMLSDFDASLLCEVIPDFHNTKARYSAFERSLSYDRAGRASSVSDEINTIVSKKHICSLLTENDLPIRVTHNDTKINNVLFDSENNAVCVIDLDTVMPGLIHYDFGDAVRSSCATADECSRDYASVDLDLAKFEALSRGFLSACGNSLTENEIRLLPESALVLTFELAVRFMTDYLDGDVYFRTDYPEHNLVRAGNQLKLALEIEKKLPEMRKVIDRYTSDDQKKKKD